MIYQIQIKSDGSASTPYLNSGCETLYEVTVEEMMSGKYSLRDFEHPNDRAQVFQATVESAQNLTPFRQEWRIVTKSETVKWVQAASQPERWEDGEIVWDGLTIDITDRKPVIEVVADYGNLPPIECFPGQLNQVFMNILANAIALLFLTSLAFFLSFFLLKKDGRVRYTLLLLAIVNHKYSFENYLFLLFLDFIYY